MLKEHNLFFIQQAISLLQNLTDAEYSEPSLLLNSGGIGPHIRHCVEHYQSFLDGISTSQIDYDARKRDRKMETDVRYAISCFSIIYETLERTEITENDVVQVKMETHSNENEPAVWMQSSFGREMMSSISHTVHHFAIIALLLHSSGKSVPFGFGVAPSTLKFQAQTIN